MKPRRSSAPISAAASELAYNEIRNMLTRGERFMKKHVQPGYDEARREFEARQHPKKRRSKKETT